MIANKHITKIIAVIMAVSVCLCLAAVIFAEDLAGTFGGEGIGVEYESKLFDRDDPIMVNIIMDDGDWEDMLENAAAEVYYQCDVEINGEMFYRVGVRPKGNTSLITIASDPDTDRFSLKLEFDQYVDGQTCYGLDKLVLNNNYADATNMKEALIYDMYQYLGADASLYNYAKIYVNDEYWGVYLALEAVEDSFLLRNYGTENGRLYKPESMNIGGDGGGGGFSMGGGGSNLNYTDDDLDSYSTIWEGEITDTTDSDHKRVVKALKNISEGTDLETYMDVDNLLKYMAVHVFSVNEDSLSGMMAHNYYLYEADGRLNILPWDYNLALGGMGGMGGRNSSDSATSLVNDAIDQAFSGTKFFDTLLENEEYLEKYHSYLRQLADEYIYGGGFDTFYDRTRSQIDSLVESDPTAFYSYEEYDTAAETLYEIVQLRGTSIQGQLDGTIPSLESEQRDSDALVDASHLDVSVMGSMSMGDSLWGQTPGNGEDIEDNGEDVEENRDGAGENREDAEETGSGGTASQMLSLSSQDGGFDPSQFGGEELPEDFDPSQFGGGELPEDFDPSQFGGGELPEDFDPSQFGSSQSGEDQDGKADSSQSGEDQDGKADSSQSGEDQNEKSGSSQSEENTEKEGQSDGSSGSSFPGNFPGGFDSSELPEDFDFSQFGGGSSMPGMDFGGSTGASATENLILYSACFAILIIALIFAKLYRRRPRRR